IFTKHGNWQLQLIPNVGNCNWKKTGLWFSPVQSYTGPANTNQYKRGAPLCLASYLING
ncbi:hypothetical protein K443DRAFT_103689, partial [Laccaria amethystina LaAM-08-1]